jgi:7-cyano-7-deazaguanine synthase
MKKGIRKENKQTEITSASIEGYYKNDLIKTSYFLDPEVLFNSWSCYKNEDQQCGECDSCRNRKNSFLKAGIKDETIYSNS